MADFTLYAPPDHMPLMREEDIIGFPVQPYPRDLFFCMSVFPNLGLFGTVGERFLVAFETNLKGRLPGKWPGLKIAMTIGAFNPRLFVQLVIERDWLLLGPALCHSHHEGSH
jgi:hypothetical protein